MNFDPHLGILVGVACTQRTNIHAAFFTSLVSSALHLQAAPGQLTEQRIYLKAYSVSIKLFIIRYQLLDFVDEFKCTSADQSVIKCFTTQPD